MRHQIQTYYSYRPQRHSTVTTHDVAKVYHHRVATLFVLILFVVAGACVWGNSNGGKSVFATQKHIVAQAAPIIKSDPALQKMWQSTLADQQGDVDIAVYNHKSGETTEYSTTKNTFNTASIVKVPILEAALLQNGQALSNSQLALATPMIENSDNDAATVLWQQAGGANGLNALYAKLGMTSTTSGSGDAWGVTQTTAGDQLKVVNAYAYPGSVLTQAAAQTIDDLLDNIEADQTWGVSAGSPNDVTVELKNGWLSDSETNDHYEDTDSWTVNSIGHIHGENQDYTIAVLTMGDPTEQAGIDAIEDLATLTWQRVVAE